MRILITAAALALSPAAALAQEAVHCTERIQHVAEKIPDISADPDVYKKMGLDEEQIEAVPATLDAARLIAASDEEGCVNLVEAAASILDTDTEPG